MLLSVCIPTWNRSSFIRLSARYWLEQIAPFADRVELIIADNASTDDTVVVLDSLRELGSFRLIRRPQNLGFNRSTFDLVAAQAVGDFVWVCGDDDYLNRGALAEVISARCRSAPSAEALICIMLNMPITQTSLIAVSKSLNWPLTN